MKTKATYDTDIVLLVILAVLAILTFMAIIYFGLGPEHGPSMYEDALKIHDGPI